MQYSNDGGVTWHLLKELQETEKPRCVWENESVMTGCPVILVFQLFPSFLPSPIFPSFKKKNPSYL